MHVADACDRHKVEKQHVCKACGTVVQAASTQEQYSRDWSSEGTGPGLHGCAGSHGCYCFTNSYYMR